MSQTVDELVAAGVALLQDAVLAIDQVDVWDVARMPMHLMNGSRAAGIAYLMNQGEYVASVRLDTKGSFRLADELCQALSIATGQEVRRVRINVSPSWETSIDHFGESSLEDGGRQDFGIWPDETRSDNEVPPTRLIHRSFSHDYAATDPRSVAKVSELMERLERWIEVHERPVLSLLNSPATEAEIAEFERRHGLTFPKSVREAYLAHDGQSTADRGRVFPARTWLPLAEIEKHLPSVQERPDGDLVIPLLKIDGGVAWVQSVDSRNGESPLVDFDGGDVVLADSFAAFLEKFVSQLESGVYVFWDGLWQTVAELEEVDE